MHRITTTLLLAFAVPVTLAAQSEWTWDAIFFGSSQRPRAPSPGYVRCRDIALPDSITLTTTPRVTVPVAWAYKHSTEGETVEMLAWMPQQDDTLTVPVLEAWCREGHDLPSFLIKYVGNHGLVYGHVPGALLTDSSIAAGTTQAYIRIATAGGMLTSAQYVERYTQAGTQRAVIARQK